MYHSIPAVRKAQLSVEEVDFETILSVPLAPQDESASSSSSSKSNIVKRRSRVTTECHMGALMEEILLSDEEFLQDDSSDVDSLAPEEDIFDLLDMLTGRRSNASASSLDDEECYELAQ